MSERHPHPPAGPALDAHLTPMLTALAKTARAGRGWCCDPVLHDEAGRIMGAVCPGCQTPIIGTIRIGKPWLGPDGQREWATRLERLDSAHFVDVDLGGTLICLSYCVVCAASLTDSDLTSCLAVEFGTQAVLAERAGRPPEATRVFFSHVDALVRLHTARMLRVRVG